MRERPRERECYSKAMKASRMLSQTGLRWNPILSALVTLQLKLHQSGCTAYKNEYHRLRSEFSLNCILFLLPHDTLPNKVISYE
jgi:hypothetical protein